jgi:lipopolysaccharide transport system ATP-binding protein
MSLPAIEVSGLSKRYVIEHESRHDTLRDTLHHTARKLWRRFRWGTGFQREEFWALKDVSFTVQPGEVVGIIGRNGAGKSTLLKILSRITEPTAGKVTLRGRVASLLEVGTGFHPDLTGRENIYLNGAILGMRRAEIRRKFDEIVAFAEVEKFLDTPVKRYSSGMYVRLAFAVAAHLEPEILIVDEVLAVGDIAFQRKCIGKMEDATRNHGHTVLVVSHNLTMINQLTKRCLLLGEGRLAADGPSAQLTNRLARAPADGKASLTWQPSQKYAFDEIVRPRSFCVLADDGHVASPALARSQSLTIEAKFDFFSRETRFGLILMFYNAQGEVLMSADIHDVNPTACDQLEPGRHTFRCNFPSRQLAAGTYYIELTCLLHKVDWIMPVDNASRLRFEIADDCSINPYSHASPISPLFADVTWQTIHA